MHFSHLPRSTPPFPRCGLVKEKPTTLLLERLRRPPAKRKDGWLTLKREKRYHWVYTVNNSLLLALWVSLRLIYSPYFLVMSMGPSCSLSEPGPPAGRRLAQDRCKLPSSPPRQLIGRVFSNILR